MNKIGHIIVKISERPRLMLLITTMLCLLAELAISLPQQFSPLLIVNCAICWLSIIILFLVSLKNNGFRVATMSLLITTPILLIAFLFQSSSLIFLFTTTLIYAFIILGIFAIKKVQQLRKVHFSFRKYRKPRQIQKVSAVIPNYNYARYLEERVNSILSQTYPIYELIILDDYSTDNSDQVIKKIIQKLKVQKPSLKVKYLPNAQNSGNVFRQWQKCFSESSGDFIWICEADDSCSKHFLNAVMQGFDDPSVILSYAETKIVDENDQTISETTRRWTDVFNTGHWDKSFITKGKKELQHYLCINNTIPNVSGVVFRRTSIPYDRYLKTSQSFTLAGDWYFYSKLLLHGDLAFFAEPLNYRRLHSKGVTLSTDNYVQYKEIVRVQNSIEKDVNLSQKTKQKISLERKNLLHNFGLSESELKYAERPIPSSLLKKTNSPVLLSIIVSAYNANGYIDQCLNSVEAAAPEKTEILVIDDGSTDNTAHIIQKHAKTNPNIKYFHKKNGGLSSVKNFGLSKAQGEYVIFMDADDEIKKNGYKAMLRTALETNADIVICDMELCSPNYSEHHAVYHADQPDRLIGFMIDGLVASSNNKMIKKSLYDKVDEFPEGKNNEDVAVTPILLILSENTQYIPSSFYRYFEREGSIQHSEFDEKRLVIFDTSKIAIDKISNLDLPAEQKDTIIGIIVTNQIINLLIYIISKMTNTQKRDRIIKQFCQKYRTLDVNDNAYIYAYCRNLGFEKLPYYIANSNPSQICQYLNPDKRKGAITKCIKYILNR